MSLIPVSFRIYLRWINGNHDTYPLVESRVYFRHELSSYEGPFYRQPSYYAVEHDAMLFFIHEVFYLSSMRKKGKLDI